MAVPPISSQAPGSIPQAGTLPGQQTTDPAEARRILVGVLGENYGSQFDRFMAQQQGGQPQAAVAPGAGAPVVGPPPASDTVTRHGRVVPGLARVSGDTPLGRDGDTALTPASIRAAQTAAQQSGNRQRIDATNRLAERYGVQLDGTENGQQMYTVRRERLASAQTGDGSSPGSGSDFGPASAAGANGGNVDLGQLRSLVAGSGFSGFGGFGGGIGATGGVLGAVGAGANMFGMRGMAFQMNKVVRSVAQSYSDAQFIGMLHSGMNIESLLYYFMAYASDKYDKKLREKMEEWTMAEMQNEAMERNRTMANTLSGILSLAGPAGVAAGYVVQGIADTTNRVSSALNGNMKSSTVLMQEVQILIQQWKVVTDLTSNLSKDLHDMAMTAVRNLR
jgi:hypothetical protein